jgi:hypothetical protein
MEVIVLSRSQTGTHTHARRGEWLITTCVYRAIATFQLFSRQRSAAPRRGPRPSKGRVTGRRNAAGTLRSALGSKLVDVFMHNLGCHKPGQRNEPVVTNLLIPRPRRRPARLRSRGGRHHARRINCGQRLAQWSAPTIYAAHPSQCCCSKLHTDRTRQFFSPATSSDLFARVFYQRFITGFHDKFQSWQVPAADRWS